jgi:hypothetical protein
MIENIAAWSNIFHSAASDRSRPSLQSRVMTWIWQPYWDLVGAIGVMIGAIVLGGDIMTFVDIPSIVIVFAGTAFVVLFRTTLGQFLGSFKVAHGRLPLHKHDPHPQSLIEEAVASGQRRAPRGPAGAGGQGDLASFSPNRHRPVHRRPSARSGAERC